MVYWIMDALRRFARHSRSYSHSRLSPWAIVASLKFSHLLCADPYLNTACHAILPSAYQYRVFRLNLDIPVFQLSWWFQTKFKFTVRNKQYREKNSLEVSNGIFPLLLFNTVVIVIAVTLWKLLSYLANLVAMCNEMGKHNIPWVFHLYKKKCCDVSHQT